MSKQPNTAKQKWKLKSKMRLIWKNQQDPTWFLPSEYHPGPGDGQNNNNFFMENVASGKLQKEILQAAV